MLKKNGGIRAPRLLVGLALYVLSVSAMAAPLLLDAQARSVGGLELAGHLQALHDASGELTFEQVRSTEHVARFEPLRANFNGGFAGRGAWWLRFDVQAAPGSTQDWWLQLRSPYVDYIDVWLPQVGADSEPTWRHRALGGLRPVSQRDLASPINVLRMDALPQKGPHTVWIRLAGHRTLSLAGAVWRLDALVSDLQRIMLQVAAVIGMTLLMAVVTLFLGATLPDRKFLWYSAYLAASALLFACSENLLSVLVLPEQPALAVRIHNLSMCLGLLTALIFARSVLDMPMQFPRIARAFQVMAALSGLALLMSLAGHYGKIAPLINLLRLGTAVLIISLCVILVRRHAPSAWPNLIGYSVYGTVGALHFAKNLDWLPFSAFNQYSYLVGMMVHMIAIFVGLGLRVRLRERQALADSQAAGARLETTVAERTQALNAEIAGHEKTEAQLRVAMDEQRNFLSMVSHEFRTPISIIGASAQMIVDERLPPGPEDVQREAGKINRAAQRMTALVDTLLADEWLESSAMQLNPRELELSAALYQVGQRYARGSGRDVAFDLPSPALTVRADPMLLNILFDNLIENAIKYSPAGGSIDLRAWREGNTACFSVRDRGAGIKDADVTQIFERFYRASTVKRQPGIGLGLFMVRRIAELHRGQVTAANAEGGGAVFTVRLPINSPHD
ncbi:sensor histidine kinase [Panacagrimonas sp.]|uniref:sensor histidine kinase n=1 Tax=Panacagrimonas sp. TaxID=2480088 RepID=UPI003B52C3A9